MSKFNWNRYAPFFTPQEYEEFKRLNKHLIEFITRIKTYRYTDSCLIVKLKDGTYRKVRTVKKKHSWRYENKPIDINKINDLMMNPN